MERSPNDSYFNKKKTLIKAPHKIYQSQLLSNVYTDNKRNMYAKHTFYLKNNDIMYEVRYDSRLYDLYETQIEEIKKSFRMTQ